MSKYWLHRIGYEWQVAYPLLEAGYLSVGFNDVADENTLNLLLGKEDFDRVFDALLGGYGNNREYLNIFLKQMSKGDRVCVPTKDGLSVYEISGEVLSKESLDLRELEKVEALKNRLTRNKEGYLEYNGSIVDLGFFRKVKQECVGFIPQETVVTELSSSISSHKTIEKIDKNLEAFIKKEKPEIDIIGYINNIMSHEKSRADKVQLYLTWLSSKDGVKEGTGGIDFFVNIKESGHKIYVCIQPETDSQNVKDWLTDKINGYKNSKSIEKDSAMLWLIANDNYFPESIKRDAGIGLKVDSYKDFEELYLNALQTDYLMKKSVINLYRKRLERIKKKANNLSKTLKLTDGIDIEKFKNLKNYKTNDNKHILIYPLVFEFQNFRYVRNHLENYVKYNFDIDYACIVADGFISLYDKNEKDCDWVYLSKNELKEVLLHNNKRLASINEAHKQKNKQLLLRSIGYSKDEIKDTNDDTKLWNQWFDPTKVSPVNNIVCKYGSLQGLYDMLNTQNFRLMGLACQNDTTEVDYVESYCEISKGVIPEDANSFFILSMLSKEDDLTMWRLYGEEAKGVCLVFEIEKFDGCNYTCRPIDYAEHRGYHKKLNIIRQLKNNGLKFKLFNRWKHFFKPFDYRIEQEIRFLFCNKCECKFKCVDYKAGKCKDVNWVKCNSNAIFTPSVDIKVDSCPLKLKKIILGPKCPEKEINRQQIANMIKDKNLFNGRDIEVTTSSIDNYR